MVDSAFMVQSQSLVSTVKALARQAGFARVGIAPAGPLPYDRQLRDWLDRGYHASMAYMAANVDKRHHAALLMEGENARSVICLAVACAPRHSAGSPPAHEEEEKTFVARYARGRDYHRLLKRRCGELMDRIRRIEPGFAGRALVDTAPLSERSYAAAAGIGWIGRNGMLVAESLGSYVLLCEIVCNLALPADGPLPNRCDDCRACIRACPTGALGEDGLLDARRCISYLTIEHRGEIAPRLRSRMGGRVFGCDACQEACPHNLRVAGGDAELLADGEPLGGANLATIAAWTPRQWDRATRGSSTRRATCEMFRRNAAIALANRGRKNNRCCTPRSERVECCPAVDIELECRREDHCD